MRASSCGEIVIYGLNPFYFHDSAAKEFGKAALTVAEAWVLMTVFTLVLPGQMGVEAGNIIMVGGLGVAFLHMMVGGQKIK